MWLSIFKYKYEALIVTEIKLVQTRKISSWKSSGDKRLDSRWTKRAGETSNGLRADCEGVKSSAALINDDAAIHQQDGRRGWTTVRSDVSGTLQGGRTAACNVYMRAEREETWIKHEDERQKRMKSLQWCELQRSNTMHYWNIHMEITQFGNPTRNIWICTFWVAEFYFQTGNTDTKKC